MTTTLINPSAWIHRYFNDCDRGFSASRAAFVPAVDVEEGKDAFLLRAELPGVAKESLSIELKDNRLVLTGNKSSVMKDSGGCCHVESSHGEFSRVFELPRNVKSDALEAEYKDGLLTLRIPKAEEAKPKIVPIK